jgi:VanZ family protein
MKLPTWLRVLCGLAIAAMVVQLLLLPEPAYAQRVVEATWDKAIHFLFFGALALLAWFATGPRWTPFIWTAVVCVGALDETYQMFTPGRTSDWKDLLADAIGAAVGLALVQALAPRIALNQGARPCVES